MDSPDNCEKSLPGMSLPKWMKRATERYDYSDICASPPASADGFFHLNNRYRTSGQNNATVECIQKRRSSRAETTSDLGIPLAEMEKRNIPDCNTPEATNFFKTVSSSSLAGLASTQAAHMIIPSRVFKMKAIELDGSMNKIQHMDKIDASDDTALTPVDTPTMTLTPAEDGSSMRLGDKMTGNWPVPCTPEVTPCSTPAVTPSCSPQVTRRMGNPFFTGTPSTNVTGSWLFRPAQPDNGNGCEGDGHRRNFLYEAKVDMQGQPNSQSAKKTIRYVPRPSELRELNFWSPTSM